MEHLTLPMHLLSFILALALLTLGITGLKDAGSAEALQSQATPGLFFGGAILIASLYGIRERRHGMAGASFVAFLAFLTSASGTIPALSRGTFDWSRADHRSASLVLVLCAFYLGAIFYKWKRARRQHAIEKLRDGMS